MFNSFVIMRDEQVLTTLFSIPSQSMPQVLLHIGPHKAASSHIQESLFKIASLLGDHNYFWPPHSVNSKSVQNYARAIRNDRVNAANHETELTVMRKFIDECRQLNRSIILSTEEFDDLRPEHISVLRNDLRGFNVTVVFVYRELLSQLVSLHFEENRFEHDFVQFSSSFSNYFFSIMDNMPRAIQPVQILSDFAAQFGGDHILAIDLVGTIAARKDIAHVVLCEILGVLCDRPELIRRERSNSGYDLVPSQVFSIYKKHVGLEKCSFCANTNAENQHFAKRYSEFAKTNKFPILESNLTMLRPYVMQVDAVFRAKFGHVLMYSNATANARSVTKARIMELDFGKFVAEPKWVEWIRSEYHEALLMKRLCNCAARAHPIKALHAHVAQSVKSRGKSSARNSTRPAVLAQRNKVSRPAVLPSSTRPAPVAVRNATQHMLSLRATHNRTMAANGAALRSRQKLPVATNTAEGDE